METRTKVINLIHHIDAVWQKIQTSDGYQDWINADVSCYLVAYQMKIVAEQFSSILNIPFQAQRSREEDLDYMYNFMFSLSNQFINQSNVNNGNCNNLIKEQNILNDHLNRILYFVQ